MNKQTKRFKKGKKINNISNRRSNGEISNKDCAELSEHVHTNSVYSICVAKNNSDFV